MQNPGVSRAIPSGILGFLVGVLIVIILRGLQSLDPLWNPGVGIVFGALFGAAFFIWGIGAFDPKLSVHGEEEEAAHHEEEADAVEKPTSILSTYVWQMVTLLIVVFVVLFAFALWGGLTLRVTDDPLASTTAVGYFTLQLPFGGPEVLLSELVVFIAFVVWMFISLVIAAWVLAWLFHFLARGVAEVRLGGTAALTAGGTAGALPARVGEATAIAQEPFPDLRAGQLTPPYPKARGLLRSLVAWLLWLVRTGINVLYVLLAPPVSERTRAGWLKSLGMYAVVFLVLYVFFYYVAIGLVLPDKSLLVPLSLVNAVLIGFLILRPKYVLQLTGLIASVSARFVRWLPKLLFQR
jgi:Na+-transporting methylmalonyl-CoA/oxaloacetate decarboxylase gamma subunit